METDLNKKKTVEYEENECKVCFNTYDSSCVKKTMPCSHDICESCVSKLVDYNGMTIRCPFCRQRHPIILKILPENEQDVQQKKASIQDFVVKLLWVIAIIVLVAVLVIKVTSTAKFFAICSKSEECPSFTSLYQEYVRRSNGIPSADPKKSDSFYLNYLHQTDNWEVADIFRSKKPCDYSNPLILPEDFDNTAGILLNRRFGKEYFDKPDDSYAGDWFQITYNKDEILEITPYKAVIYKREDSLVTDAYIEALRAMDQILKEFK